MVGSVSSVFAETVSGTVGMFANSCKFTDKDVIRFMLKCVLPREKYKCYLSIDMMLSPETVVKGQVSHRTVVLSFDNLGEKKRLLSKKVSCVCLVILVSHLSVWAAFIICNWKIVGALRLRSRSLKVFKS